MTGDDPRDPARLLAALDQALADLQVGFPSYRGVVDFEEVGDDTEVSEVR